MTTLAMIDPDTIGQLLVEGMTIINEAYLPNDAICLEGWLQGQANAGAPLRPLQRLVSFAELLLEDATILDDERKQLRVSVAYNALAGLLSCYGIDAAAGLLTAYGIDA